MLTPRPRLRPFRSKHDNHDFQRIYDTIKEYYPIENTKRATTESIASTEGWQKMSALMNDNFVSQKNYRARWSKFNQFLKKQVKKPVRSTMSLFNCCYSGEVIVEEFKGKDFIKHKKLEFYISVLDSFFSIVGVDCSAVFMSVDNHFGPTIEGHYIATHCVTVSPVFEYETPFKLLEEKIREFFPGYSFIPYEIGMSVIPNISVDDDTSNRDIIDSVYEALFGQIALHDALTRGDKRYGFNDWVKPFNQKESKLNDLIAQHTANASKETTLHKVWKLQEHRRLDTFKPTGNILFGSDLFDILDLTDTSKAIIVSSERHTPYEMEYTINSNVIELSEYFSLRITDLQNDSLTVNLVLNIQHTETSMKGEAIEMKFVVMDKGE